MGAAERVPGATVAEALSFCGPARLVTEVALPQDLRVTAVTDDSRTVEAGSLFLAVRGERSDGHGYIEDAVAAGAAAVLCEQGAAVPAQVPVPCLEVQGLEGARSAIAELIYGNPSSVLRMIGITGTNGKTSTAHFTVQLAELTNRPAGYLGTLGCGRLPFLRESAHTTPPATQVPSLLRSMLESGAELAALEVSSHALAQGRVEAIEFDVAVLTNFSRDHLDYHQTEDGYAAAKLKLFEQPELRWRVVNGNDELGRRLLKQYPPGQDRRTLAFAPAEIGGDLTWSQLTFHADGVRGIWHWQGQSVPFVLPLLGCIAVENVAAAVLGLLCVEQHLSLEELVEAGAALAGVPGRMEAFRGAGRPQVIVDYAHTPAALEQALQAVRAHSPGRCWVVFGCGGDRDQGKRPLMGQVAARLAEVVVVTSDNPRSEAPEDIIKDILPPLAGHEQLRVIVDREEAIVSALRGAAPDDVILVAGKGHEDYQEVKGQRQPVDDRAIIRRELGVPG